MKKYPDSLDDYFLASPLIFKPKGMNRILLIFTGFILLISLFFAIISIPFGIMTFLFIYLFVIRRHQKKYEFSYFQNKQTGGKIKHKFYNTLSDPEIPLSTLTNLISRKKFAELINHFQGTETKQKNSIALHIYENAEDKKYYGLLLKNRVATRNNDQEAEGISDVFIIENSDYTEIADLMK
ncbi:hypothetical protein RHO15_04375 [Utexia brackfieldae]|uniref:hypothetical protein n=1 Tax=Utexia brackfieldae TaxID=3074108 RepID=UPI00370D51A3